MMRTSDFGPQETARRLVAAVESRGMAVFASFDHAAAARAAGLDLRPTEVVVFGDPRAGTPLMQAKPTLALELPLRVLVVERDDGRTVLVAEDPADAAARHDAPGDVAPLLARMRAAVDAVMAEAAAAPAVISKSYV